MAVSRMGDNYAKPLQAFQIFGDRIHLLLRVFARELCGELCHCPFAGGGAEEVADGSELFFG